MARRVIVLAAVVVIGLAGALAAQQPQGAPAGAGAPAQGAPGGPGAGRQGGTGGGRGGAAVPASIDAATARKVMAAAEAAAAANEARVAIALIDANGDLVSFIRLDGASARAVTSSQGKARAALLFGVPTREIQEATAANRPISAMVTLPPAGAWEITPMQGGLPIKRDGKVIAGIGVGGVAPALDEKIAQAGIDAIAAR